MTKYSFAAEILNNRKRCSNCWHWRNNICALYSTECATAVFNQKETPPRWTSYEDGEANERRLLKRVP